MGLVSYTSFGYLLFMASEGVRMARGLQLSLSLTTGLLHPGHVIHEINGRSLAGYSVDDVADLMVCVGVGGLQS